MKGSFNVVSLTLWSAALSAAATAFFFVHPVAGAVLLVVGWLVGLSPRMMREWERGVLLRFGRFERVLDSGISWVLPGVDKVSARVDMRIRSTSFAAEKTLTKDTVPVNVDAVLFWVVTDAKRAIVEVQDYASTVSWAAQTTLRDVIGQTELVQMISEREDIDRDLREIIDAKTSDWGITVQSVEIRDVRIPGALEDAMSRKAQADREREARIILAESELQVAEEMDRAAQIYNRDPVAMKIRAMNMTYESIKERGALMVVPTDMVSSMSGVMGMASSAFELEEDGAAPGEGLAAKRGAA